jgi:hypothetical protein
VSSKRGLDATLSDAGCPDRSAKTNKRSWRAFILLYVKSALAGRNTSPVKGKKYRRRYKSTWTTITTSGLTWASACNHRCHVLVAFDMGDTVDLTGLEIYYIL